MSRRKLISDGCSHSKNQKVIYLPVAGSPRKNTYTTVGTVRPPALLGCLIDLNVLDDEVGSVETLCVGVCLCVLEEVEEEFGRLFRPTRFADAERFTCWLKRWIVSSAWLEVSTILIALPIPPMVELFPPLLFRAFVVSVGFGLGSPIAFPIQTTRGIRRTLTSPADATCVSPEWNSLLLLPHILKIADGALKSPSVDSLSGLAGVLEGNTKVGTAGAG